MSRYIFVFLCIVGQRICAGLVCHVCDNIRIVVRKSDNALISVVVGILNYCAADYFVGIFGCRGHYNIVFGSVSFRYGVGWNDYLVVAAVNRYGVRVFLG